MVHDISSQLRGNCIKTDWEPFYDSSSCTNPQRRRGFARLEIQVSGHERVPHQIIPSLSIHMYRHPHRHRLQPLFDSIRLLR